MCTLSTVALLVVGLVLIVRLGLHLPTILRGFLFYTQVSSVAVAYLPVTFRLKVDVVCFFSLLVTRFVITLLNIVVYFYLESCLHE